MKPIARPLASAVLALALLGAQATLAAGQGVPQPDTRLVVAGPVSGAGDGSSGAGGYDLALVVTLPKGWHTYWRSPGDVGVPPMLTPQEADNLAGLDVGFPVPRRYFDGYSESIIYEDAVTLPIRVAATEADAPVTLRLGFDFGYCKEICVPAHASFDVDLHPGMTPDTGADRLVAAARATLPLPEDNPAARLRLAEFAPVPVGPGAPPRYRLVVEGPDAGRADLDVFVEGPEGWSLPLPKPQAEPREGGETSEGHTFLLDLQGIPKGAPTAGAALRITMVSGTRGVEAIRRLP
ncbi:protein-disulfide reductase DsbD domain-containing protein [Methylobrevis pamukkalensis]|uniref:Thiol:disulfide interchange protein DsbD N-terminal domain-containing protein n=1 Tax=Methylobrevis pamukkalensis TaxID=1439726 RepID=A0A1E3GRB1_9HYPH|nr:protein-disulfide reductase DsbD domain-containing protein [Methylobrevis pamukkalensis]ODN66588.1 hypothetical protein A6302_04433 [Methylobrevis pamukkalensis]